MIYYEKNYGTTGKAYGTMKKTMALYGSLWNFDLRRKQHRRLSKTMKLWFTLEKNNGNIPKQFKFLNKYIALDLGFTMEKL